MQRKETGKVLDFSTERMEKHLSLGERIHLTTKKGGIFYEKMPDGSVKETIVPRTNVQPRSTVWQRILASIARWFA